MTFFVTASRIMGLRGLLAVAVTPFLFLATGCSGGDRTATNTVQDSVLSAAKATGAALLPTSNPSCGIDEWNDFDRVSGEIVDFEQTELPNGLYLAVSADLLVESKQEGREEGGAQARMLVREIPGERSAEIGCAENLERLGDEFEISVTGPVKFETTGASEANAFTARQFYFFKSKGKHGVRVSNARIVGRVMTLKQAVSGPSSSGHVIRLDDRTYLVRLTRERENARARLFIRLEHIPQN